MAGFDEVGAALALLRKRAGFSQDDIAAALGMRGPTSVSAIENGNPRADTIQRYLVALGKSPGELAAALAELAYSEPGAPAEVRERAATDPLDQLASDFQKTMQSLVEEVKRRSPRA